MVQKDIENSNEYRIINTGTAMPAGDKQQPIAAKKVAPRELPNDTRNIFMKPPAGNLPLPKERGTTMDAAKAQSIKRQLPSSVSSPSRPLPPGNMGSNGHLVYVRRKLETEASKRPACVNNVQEEPTQESKVSPPNTSLGLGKPTETVLPEPNHSEGPNAAADQPSQHRKQRFLQLQAFLKICDEPNHEYIQKLQSLSSDGRSRYAYDLERRALDLSVVEAKEMQRMRELNVLGKSSISTQIRSPEQHVRGK